MKKFYLLFVFAFYGFFANAQNPDAFIMTFEASSFSNLNIVVPIEWDSTNSYTIDFGNGTVFTNQKGPVYFEYGTFGTYTVTLTGVFKRINFNNSNLAYWLKTIEQWGTNQWESMEGAFYGCSNLIINATDVPDLSQVTNMSNMFRGATSLNQPLNNWDVSNVTDMSWMFFDASLFNQPLNDWDVSNVTNMSFLFGNASSFNQPLNNWDVSNVINMRGMLGGTSFNQPLDNWDVSNVTNMSSMFSNAQLFNQPLDNWDVSNVTNMSSMFSHTQSFNQPLDNWDVSNVTNMGSMYTNATSFNQSLNSWDVSNVTSTGALQGMSRMFEGATSFNQPLNNWDVSNVTLMANMFYGATSFNQNLNDWDVSSVTTMQSMFSGASSFNQPLNNWDTSSVINMRWMFVGATSFNQPLNNWDVLSVTNMYGMFSNASSFNQPLNDWDVSNVVDMSYMFENAFSFNQSLSNWDVSNVTFMARMFRSAASFNQSLFDWDFKSNISFGGGNNLGFLDYSGLNTINYDLLLQRFVTLELQNKTLSSFGLKYCDEENRDYLINSLGWTITGDAFSENCGDNHIIGSILYDENNNGCDTNDLTMNNIWITASNETTSSTTLSANDEYILNVYEGSYVINLNVPDYFTYLPSSPTISFEGAGNSETLNFCLTANQTVQDLNIALLPITEARPGFETNYQLIVQNIGTQTVNNVSVSLDFDSTMQSFVSADPSTSSTTTNQLNFEIESLSPFSSTIIDFTMQTFTPPTVNGDDILNFTAVVSPNTDDYTPNDNTFELEQIVVNSYDPNDKQVLQGSEIHIDDVNEYLHYLIRFQNTGTASAIHVRIEDELHESLDWNTIQILNSSHNYRVEIKDGNQVAFIFNNINLPYEDEDEEGSNGFIAYKIKPVAGLEVGDIITGNEAYIYFDYNLPIITNTTSTEVVEDTSSVSQYNLNNLISVYPNPTNGILHLSSKENITIEEIKIYNLQGRELFGSVQHLETINIQDLSSGIYLMNITTNQGSISKRVIKK